MKKQFIRASEVAQVMEVNRTRAYQIVRSLNSELKGIGYITISGKSPIA